MDTVDLVRDLLAILCGFLGVFLVIAMLSEWWSDGPNSGRVWAIVIGVALITVAWLLFRR